jgi:hypothetical protein
MERDVDMSTDNAETNNTVPNWIQEVGSDASLTLEVKLKIMAEEIREAKKIARN